LRITEQETRLTLHEHDGDDDDNLLSALCYKRKKVIIDGQ